MAIVRRKGWGLGDANCPSVEQLMGITDPDDPCQQLTPQLVGSGPLAPGQTYAPGYLPSGLPVSSTTTTPSGASASAGLMSWLQTNPAAMLGLGAALLVVVGGAFLGGGRRR